MNPDLLAPPRGPSSELPTGLRIGGWIALLGLPILAFLSDAPALEHGLACLGLVILLAGFGRNRSSERRLFPLEWRLLRWGIGFFFLSAIVNVFYPACRFLPDRIPLMESLRDFWQTLEAAIAAGLFLLLVRRKSDALAFLGLLTLTLLLLTLWSPLDHGLHGLFAPAPPGRPPYRLCGSKGNPARYADLLFYGSFFLWILAFTSEIRHASLPRWAWWAGRFLAFAIPLFQRFRNSLPSSSFYGGWLPGRGPQWAANPWSFFVVTGALILVGLSLWRMFVEGSARRRFVIVAGGLFLILINIALTGTRTTLLLYGIVGLLTVATMLRLGKMLAIVSVVFSFGILLLCLANPQAFNISSAKERVFVWKVTYAVICESWPWGTGYGTARFAKSWDRHRQDIAPEDPYYMKKLATVVRVERGDHAHNLWLQLLAERGVLGFLAFHVLWLGTFATLLRPLARGTAMRLPREDPSPAASSSITLFGEDKQDEARKDRPAIGSIPAFLSMVALGILLLHGMIEYPVRGYVERIFWLGIAIGVADRRGWDGEASSSKG